MFVKYSIVIPTRNCAEYLLHAVHSILESSRDDIEVIVSDNHSTDDTANLLSQLNDSRLRIIMPSVFLPMAGHYEFAINEAMGEWVTLLGADDAVMPYIFDRLDHYIAKFPKIEIISSARALYFWSGCEDIYGNNVLDYQSRQKTALRSTKRDLMSALEGRLSCLDMPQIYTTTMIKRSLYKEIKIKSGGCFYHSIIPDIYSAVALCLSRDRYLRVDEPLFWVGTSNKSMSRSDRIYREAEQFNQDYFSAYPCVPLSVSDQIPYAIHSSVFSAMYVYECLLSSPLKKKEHLANRLRARVLAAVLMTLRSQERRSAQKEYIISAVRKECRDYDISMATIRALSVVYFLKQKLDSLVQWPIKIITRFGLISRTVCLRSTSRSEFPTIADASYAVLQMRKSKL